MVYSLLWSFEASSFTSMDFCFLLYKMMTSVNWKKKQLYNLKIENYVFFGLAEDLRWGDNLSHSSEGLLWRSKRAARIYRSFSKRKRKENLQLSDQNIKKLLLTKKKLEKAMAPHSSTLAWKILWMEEPGRLQSMGLLRVGHDWATSLSCLLTFHFHALEKEMATHSRVLAWRIPGMGEPGGLTSVGLQSRTRLKWLSSK